jgi:class 3 adenylate cyclase
MRCANCSFENPPEAKFCENCGKPLERRCPNCGRPVSATAKFCANCGYNLSAVRPVVSESLARLQQSAPQALQDKVRAAGQRLQGQRKLVTVLFADIVSSTELAERLDPEDWREIVSGVHQRLSEAVHRFEGHVAQLLGDGVLVFFGAPLAHEDDAERAVRAALAALDSIRQYAGQLHERDLGRELQIRVGINTGTVVVGEVGSDLHMEYLAIGDTVNLAARLQTAAAPDSILVADSTEHHLGQLFELRDAGRLMVKGKAEPVQAYEILRAREGARRQRGIPGLSSPMVGRQRELATLLQVSADLRAGHGAVVSILGEAGLGKSRLVAEWRRAVVEEAEAAATDGEDRHGALIWTEGRCLSYGTALPYHLAISILRSLIGVSSEAPAEEAARVLWRECQAHLAEKAADLYPYLAHMLGLPLEDALAARLSYLDRKTLLARYVAAYKALLQGLAAVAPVIVIADDIQWADPSSVELGLQIVGVAAESPIVFVLVSRPDDEAPSARLLAAARDLPGVGSTELHLAPLNAQDSRQLVGNLLQDAVLADDLRQHILAKAEGNPFYVEEVTRMLIDHNGLERRDGRWVAASGLANIEIPDTIQGVIMARVDRLPEEARRALQVAAVIGRRFPADVLDLVLEEEDGHEQSA